MTRRSAEYALRGSLWLIPSLTLLMSIILALGLVQLDLRFHTQLHQHWPAVLRPDVDGARQILATIGNSMITVAGVVFSITVVALSLAANQYSPRVLRNFMRDRLNQTMAGMFVGAFVYSILVLMTVGAHEPAFVPYLSVWFAVLLAVANSILFIFFIHHTSRSIQVSEMAAQIATETIAALEAVAAACTVAPPADIANNLPVQQHWQVVPAPETGFIQDVDVQQLFKLASSKSLIMRVDFRIGDFVIAGRPMVSIAAAAAIDTALVRKIQGLFGINAYRTIEQDPVFGIRQLVDIALRALSPGINDASTAVNCIDFLGAILHRVIQVKHLRSVHSDGAEPRLILQQPNAEHLIDVALTEIRRSAQTNAAVLLRMLRTLQQLLEDVDDADLRAHLRRHVHLLINEAELGLTVAADRTEVIRAARGVLAIRANRTAR